VFRGDLDHQLGVQHDLVGDEPQHGRDAVRGLS
jgi:hypothetical protein